MTMKKVLTIAILIGLSLSISSKIFAQEKEISKSEKKELKKEKKAKRKAEIKLYEEARHDEASDAIQELDFVLEASTLYSKRGHQINVSDNINFISVKDDKVVLQLAFQNYNGLNGLGGVTLSGQISKKEFRKDKHGNQYLSFNVIGAILNAEVRIMLGASDNYADADVNATTRSDRIRFRGKLIPGDKTIVYKSGFEY